MSRNIHSLKQAFYAPTVTLNLVGAFCTLWQVSHLMLMSSSILHVSGVACSGRAFLLSLKRFFADGGKNFRWIFDNWVLLKYVEGGKSISAYNCLLWDLRRVFCHWPKHIILPPPLSNGTRLMSLLETVHGVNDSLSKTSIPENAGISASTTYIKTRTFGIPGGVSSGIDTFPRES